MQLEILVSLLYHSILQGPLDGSYILDIGANAGLHSIPLLNIIKSKGGHLVAFEPLPSICQELRKNLEDGVSLGLCTIHEKALGELSSKSLFIENIENPALSRIVSPLDTLAPSERIIEIQIEALDNLVSNQKVSFIKADCETYDFIALRGGRQLIEKSRMPIIFENPREWGAKKHGYSCADFFDFWHSIGYLIYDLHANLLTSSKWLAEDICFEFLAVHSQDAARETMLKLIAEYWDSIDSRPVLNEWTRCVEACTDPIGYLNYR